MRVWTRAEWGAKPARSVARFSNPEFIFAHHTTGATLGADESDDWVRNIQNQHFAQGWADIGYSWLYDAYGNVFEGRGWGVVGSHTLGYNSRGHGFAFLGNGDKELAPEALQALRWLVTEHDRKYGVKPVRGHRDVYATHCPGDWIQSHFALIRDGSAAVTPGPVVLPSPPVEGDTYSVEVMVSDMPVLRRGSQGQHVRIAQGLLVANGRRVTVDGDLGPGTESALREWQAAAGLGADGVIGRETWRRLLCI